MSKRRMVWPWIIALSLATVIQFLCLFLRVADNLEGIRNVALGFGSMLTGAILFCVLWGLPNVRRVRTLRQQFPEAVVLGAQVHYSLGQRLERAFPQREGEKTYLGFICAVVCDADGIGLWMGRGRRPDRRAFVPWSAVARVAPGSITLSRQLTSVRATLVGAFGAEGNEHLPPLVEVDFVPNREGAGATAAILSEKRVAGIAASIEQIRVAAARARTDLADRDDPAGA